MKNGIDDAWLFPAVMGIVAIGMVWFLYGNFKKRNPDRKFQMRITDIWALTLGLTPCIYLATQIRPQALPYVITMIIGQCIGAFWMHLRNEAGSESSRKHGFVAAVNIFVGAVLGASLPAVLVIGLMLVMRAPLLALRLFSFDAPNNERPRRFRRPDFSKKASKPVSK